MPNELFKCGYCKKTIEDQWGNSSHFVEGKICNNCNDFEELPRRLKAMGL